LLDPKTVDIVFLFGDIEEFDDGSCLPYIRSYFSNAHVVGASTARTIENGHLSDHSMVATAIAFENGSVEIVAMDSLGNDNL
jgi:hypothetical protein